jgi:hypothetical protein
MDRRSYDNGMTGEEVVEWFARASDRPEEIHKDGLTSGEHIEARDAHEQAVNREHENREEAARCAGKATKFTRYAWGRPSLRPRIDGLGSLEAPRLSSALNDRRAWLWKSGRGESNPHLWHSERRVSRTSSASPCSAVAPRDTQRVC